jgi:hypothetical protein
MLILLCLFLLIITGLSFSFCFFSDFASILSKIMFNVYFSFVR